MMHGTTFVEMLMTRCSMTKWMQIRRIDRPELLEAMPTTTDIRAMKSRASKHPGSAFESVRFTRHNTQWLQATAKLQKPED